VIYNETIKQNGFDEEANAIQLFWFYQMAHYVLLLAELTIMENIFDHIPINKYITKGFTFAGLLLIIVNAWTLYKKQNLTLYSFSFAITSCLPTMTLLMVLNS
jgi:hypothetical protein